MAVDVVGDDGVCGLRTPVYRLRNVCSLLDHSQPTRHLLQEVHQWRLYLFSYLQNSISNAVDEWFIGFNAWPTSAAYLNHGVYRELTTHNLTHQPSVTWTESKTLITAVN